MNVIEKVELSKTRELRIVQDPEPVNPRKDFDHAGIMVCFHRRYDLGDTKHGINQEEFEGMDDEQAEKYLKKEHGAIAMLPLFLYDHGGITMRAGSGFSCPWDSGCVGFIYATKESVKKIWGDTKVSKKKLLEILRLEVKEYDMYLTGDVYGFQVIEKQTCNLGHVHENVIDSCWGFFGDDFDGNGLLDHAASELTEEEEEKMCAAFPKKKKVAA